MKVSKDKGRSHHGSPSAWEGCNLGGSGPLNPSPAQLEARVCMDSTHRRFWLQWRTARNLNPGFVFDSFTLQLNSAQLLANPSSHHFSRFSEKILKKTMIFSARNMVFSFRLLAALSLLQARTRFCFSQFCFPVLIFASLLGAEKTDSQFLLFPNATSGERHSPEYCAMYDICGERSDGKVLNCPYGTPAVKPDEFLSAKIQSLCPMISGNVCCTEAQFDTLRAQVQQAIPFLVGCPACLRNFLNLFCELSCSPNQSLFINVTSIAKVRHTE
ncbi:Niemann-Pick C1-like protein 1 [Vitis vinifera]|uniref:Niemann-Pick C1-like protein 1 n=1 Tax=Vitis vinifera TaxID=29760 RepID=A0A438EKS7_VITVI|nr:Niemann-Pick C1-like protein 1 [Vitis vinifera]